MGPWNCTFLLRRLDSESTSGRQSFMGSDWGGGRVKTPRKALACKNILCVGVLPFSLGLLLIFALFKSAPLGVHHRNLQEGELPAQEPPLCPQTPPCNCSQEIANSTDLKNLEGALTRSSLNKVLGAANSSDPQEQTVRINEDSLPSIFLFVGVLSGRGYRYEVFHASSFCATLEYQNKDNATKVAFLSARYGKNGPYRGE